ncbi:hypothetical protein [Acerihabitans arboris]|uniref:Uncharacterized protein n=1 Tax=Acerihabitans arboris TaxID=2691583 RepID=A0A845SBU1_9GAMM|nr:hypothetical protein [Acerihabitans arboris]NDL62303.1 hypothetical protein [Acerihabitans arboris]
MLIDPAGYAHIYGDSLRPGPSGEGASRPSTRRDKFFSPGANTLSALAARLTRARGPCPEAVARARDRDLVQNPQGGRVLFSPPKVHNTSNAVVRAPNIIIATTDHLAQVIQGLRANSHYETLEFILGKDEHQGIISYFNCIDQYTLLLVIIDKFKAYIEQQKSFIFKKIVGVVEAWPDSIKMKKGLFSIKGRFWPHFCREALNYLPHEIYPFIYAYLLEKMRSFPAKYRIGVFTQLMHSVHYLPGKSNWVSNTEIFHRMLAECEHYPMRKRTILVTQLIKKLIVLPENHQLEVLAFIWQKTQLMLANEFLWLIEKEIAYFYYHGLMNTLLNRNNLRFFDEIACKYYPKVTDKIPNAAAW